MAYKNKQPKRTWSWNQECYRDSTYFAPDGEEFCLKHLAKHMVELKYEYKCTVSNTKQKGTVSTNITYDHHCFTRERKEDDTCPTIVTDNYSDGKSVERVFCNKRYEFSKKLIKITKDLSYKLCRESKTFGKAIRLEEPDRQRPGNGIYIVIKVRPNKHNKTLNLFVETAHFRHNEPHEADLRKEPRKYMLILGNWIKDGRHGYNSLIP